MNKEYTTGQPKLLAIGEHKKAIYAYYITIDREFLLLPAKDIMGAVAYLFKANYAFGTSYDDSLRGLFSYLECLIFKAQSKGDKSNSISERLLAIENITI